jgi:DNA-binding NarL/FixJ family response regulator
MKTLDLELIGEAESEEEALNNIRNHHWDAAILNTTMPGRGGLDILKTIKMEKPKLPIIVLSMDSGDETAIRAIKAGAAGTVTLDNAFDQMARAIRKVIQGGKYVCPQLAEKLAIEMEQGPSENLHETLSDREYLVMCKIASGKTVSVIAQDLTLSVKTISTYRCRLLDKMKMENNAQLTLYAVQRGIVK